jgi:hypothetical protein
MPVLRPGGASPESGYDKKVIPAQPSAWCGAPSDLKATAEFRVPQCEEGPTEDQAPRHITFYPSEACLVRMLYRAGFTSDCCFVQLRANPWARQWVRFWRLPRRMANFAAKPWPAKPARLRRPL